jgi:hypothetical protein
MLMSDNMRGRFNYQKREGFVPKSEGGIFGIWDEQRRMQAEEDKMAKELLEAKRKAKELQKSLRKHRYGETKNEFTDKFKNYLSNYLLIVNNFIARTKSIVLFNKKLSSVVTAVFVIALGGIFGLSQINSSSTATLGDSISSSTIPVGSELPREKPDFTLLFPEGTNSSDYDVVRISPSEADPSYTYLDRFTENGQIFKVTQQEIPSSFDLAKTATDFQATSIIQIDDSVIYHGYSEKGGIQSILFVKDNKLISIRSPEKFADDLWASYYLSLK